MLARLTSGAKSGTIRPSLLRATSPFLRFGRRENLYLPFRLLDQAFESIKLSPLGADVVELRIFTLNRSNESLSMLKDPGLSFVKNEKRMATELDGGCGSTS